jgi:hypothetical protein
MNLNEKLEPGSGADKFFLLFLAKWNTENNASRELH